MQAADDGDAEGAPQLVSQVPVATTRGTAASSGASGGCNWRIPMDSELRRPLGITSISSLHRFAGC